MRVRARAVVCACARAYGTSGEATRQRCILYGSMLDPTTGGSYGFQEIEDGTGKIEADLHQGSSEGSPSERDGPPDAWRYPSVVGVFQAPGGVSDSGRCHCLWCLLERRKRAAAVRSVRWMSARPVSPVGYPVYARGRVLRAERVRDVDV